MSKVKSRRKIKVLLLATCFFFSSLVLAEESQGIFFDDGCGDRQEVCEFWQCYDEGLCNLADEPSVQEGTVGESKVQKRSNIISRLLTSEQGKMKRTIASCPIYMLPKDNAEPVGQALITGKRLWVVPSVTGWSKVYRRVGPAYVRSECFE